MRKLAIIGAGGHGRVCADIAHAMRVYDEIAFLDDNPDLTNLQFPYLGESKNWESLSADYEFFIGIGSSLIRRRIQSMLEERGAPIATLVHPSAVLGSNVTLGNGSVLMPATVINTGSSIGRGVIVNTSASVDHDCRIDDFVHVAVGSHLCGTVTVGSDTWIGAGATVINNVSIAEKSLIAAGAVVVASIAESGLYKGVPARKDSSHV